MNDTERAIAIWNNELLATLIRRMAGSGLITESGAIALAEENRAHVASILPQYAEQFLKCANMLQDGIREECAANR